MMVRAEEGADRTECALEMAGPRRYARPKW